MSPISLISILVLSLPARGAAGAQGDTAIARIRREYAAVNAQLPRCEHRQQDVFGMSTEGGTLDVYRCGRAIRKLVATFYGETGQSREEWYLEGGRPFFFFRVEQRYNRPFGRVVRRNEERLYLRGGTMIRWIGDDGARSVTSAEARRQMGELSEEAAELLDRARTGRTDAQ
jgi:hypothetical protein